MRFIPTNCIREGMKLSKKLVGKNGELMLNSGTVLRPSYVDKIVKLGYNGLYIEDDLSDDIEIRDVISENLRYRTVDTVRKVFADIEGSGATVSKVEDITRVLDEIIDEVMGNPDVMVNMIDLKVYDDYTFYHSTNVSILSLVIGNALNLSRGQLDKLGLAAILHDIGKVFIPKTVLNKPGKLTLEEFEQIKQHSTLGFQYLKEKFMVPAVSYVGVLQHHEKFDGTGYPDGLHGKEISLFARIISVSDVYDALVSKRPYRNALSPSDAMEYIMGGASTEFDPEVVALFCKRIAPYPVGTCVRLSNDASAIVAENYSSSSMRPLLKVIRHGKKRVKPYYLNLRDDHDALDIVITGIEDL